MALAAADHRPMPLIAGAIPLIDAAGHLAGDFDASRTAAAQLRWAFEHVGFYYLTGHGVLQSLIDRTYEAAARFHAQPTAKKLTLRVNEHNIGYLPISQAASAQGGAHSRKPSQNEAYFLRGERTPNDPLVLANRRFHGLNQWPDELPGFRETALEYMRTLEALCRRLAPLYALALDLPAEFFDASFAEPHMILRLSRYSVLDGEDETLASLVPHTDSGFMTLLPPNPVPGLSILLPNGQWIDAPVVEGAFVVNGGDIFTSLDERAVPLDAASCPQCLGPGALRDSVLLRSRSRRDNRMPTELSRRSPPSKIPADPVWRLCLMVRAQKL
jgi:isopenicillin N synthase-like dioxygenase